MQGSTKVTPAFGSWQSLECDWLFLPVNEGTVSPDVQACDEATGGELGRALTSGEFTGKAYEVFVTPVTAGRNSSLRRIALVGAGKPDDASADRLRRVATVAALVARDRKATKVAFACPADTFAQPITEGLVLATFDSGSYKTFEHEVWQPERLVVWMAAVDDAAKKRCEASIDRGIVMSEASNMARSLANEPGNRLRPREFADRAAALASGYGLKVDVLDENRIAELGMGLLLGVARGSEEPPRLLALTYDPEKPAADAAPVLGLVGKGVTFDTGGISIKPSQGMERMKDDMAGGAAVISAMCAIARLRAPCRVIGVVPMAENMPGGDAIRPGDVLTSAAGKSVEVLDTDAEGRLILADALWYARRLGATHLVDVATLTGACMVALGNSTSGLFGRPQPWVDTVLSAASAAGDRLWQMPLFDDYREQLKSDIADLKNVGGRPGGAITAAIFLGEFAGEGAWAHLDIAGTAWAEDSKPYMPKGPTGAAVRTLANLAFADLTSSGK